MKFPLAELKAVREAVGNGMLIEILWSGCDVEGVYTLDDNCAFLNEAKKYIDIVQIRASQGDENHPTFFNLLETPFLEDAAYIKRSVPGLIVSSVGGYYNPETCDKTIAEDKIDMVAMARAWISNPGYGKLVGPRRGYCALPAVQQVPRPGACGSLHLRLLRHPHHWAGTPH